MDHPEAMDVRPREHPDRSLIDAEIHARPVRPLAGPLRVRRVAFMAESPRSQLPALRSALAARQGAKLRQETRQLEYESGGYQVTAEVHNEFATLTWIGPIGDWTPWPQDIGLDLFADMPVIAATRIDVVPSEVIADQALAGFDPLSLCYSALYDGHAQAATDFVIDGDRFTRFELAAGRSGELRRGVLVRRLLEIDTYRSLVLLGLPLARSLAPQVQGLEERLSAVTHELALGTSIGDNQQSLDALHGLSLEVERTSDDVAFRFAATNAYVEVLRNRLVRLGEVSIGEFTTIARYLENRIDPAVATCQALEKRLGALAAKLERSTELLNTRISLSIETQNQDVLDTISRTARNQYRLQKTVEGLSIIAISYYALALIGDVLSGAEPVLPFPREVMVALSAPVVLVVTWLALRLLRRSEDEG
ncbi:MAG: DUF3422 domain-containing protein [Devosia sp.]|nr:DUF3422 domain-containing protein [Devosia sp.]